MTIHRTEIDPLTLRKAFACLPSGVAAVCAVDAVGVQPALVSVCVSHTSTTWPILKQATRLGISVLADVHQADLQLTYRSLSPLP